LDVKSIEDLTLKQLVDQNKELKREIEELKKNKPVNRAEAKKVLLHAMSPMERDMYRKEEVLSSDEMEKAIDFIIADNKGKYPGT